MAPTWAGPGLLSFPFARKSIRFLIFGSFLLVPPVKRSNGSIIELGTATIRTNDISYNSQKPDISYTDNWYKNETGHFVQKTFRTKLN